VPGPLYDLGGNPENTGATAIVLKTIKAIKETDSILAIVFFILFSPFSFFFQHLK